MEMELEGRAGVAGRVVGEVEVGELVEGVELEKAKL